MNLSTRCVKLIAAFGLCFIRTYKHPCSGSSSSSSNNRTDDDDDGVRRFGQRRIGGRRRPIVCVMSIRLTCCGNSTSTKSKSDLFFVGPRNGLVGLVADQKLRRGAQIPHIEKLKSDKWNDEIVPGRGMFET
uniref:MOSC domain-containing protein n=1 Tax=Globodera pallida TaxID=36090 RepID=A0A183BTA2_GLOPA